MDLFKEDGSIDENSEEFNSAYKKVGNWIEEAEKELEEPHVLERYYEGHGSERKPSYHITKFSGYRKPTNYTPISICINAKQAHLLSDFIEVVERHTGEEIKDIKDFIYKNNYNLCLNLEHILDKNYILEFIKGKKDITDFSPQSLFQESFDGNVKILDVPGISGVRGHHNYDDWSPVHSLVQRTNLKTCPAEMSIQRIVKAWVQIKYPKEKIPEIITPDFITEIFKCNAEKFIRDIP